LWTIVGVVTSTLVGAAAVAVDLITADRAGEMVGPAIDSPAPDITGTEAVQGPRWQLEIADSDYLIRKPGSECYGGVNFDVTTGNGWDVGFWTADPNRPPVDGMDISWGHCYGRFDVSINHGTGQIPNNDNNGSWASEAATDTPEGCHEAASRDSGGSFTYYDADSPEHIDAAVRGSLCIATEARLVRVRFVEYRFEEETAEGAITLDVTTWVLDSGPS